VDAARGILRAYRRGFVDGKQALVSVHMGLRSFVKTLGIEGDVSQRLKREDRIVRKLTRFPDMGLEVMDDIGGCRVVVPTLTDLRALEAHVVSEWQDEIDARRDYVTSPKAESGYRAIHIVVRRSTGLAVFPEDLPVEVQLRTIHQQVWADNVEAIEGLTGEPLKDARGDPATVEGFRVLAEALARLDEGQPGLEPVLVALGDALAYRSRGEEIPAADLQRARDLLAAIGQS
jgi:hypothetical protein